ncbi:hypothetical protein CEXT_682011, partial [Caerostris extrusa]
QCVSMSWRRRLIFRKSGYIFQVAGEGASVKWIDCNDLSLLHLGRSQIMWIHK